jgi:hypothetical protein
LYFDIVKDCDYGDEGGETEEDTGDEKVDV